MNLNNQEDFVYLTDGSTYPQLPTQPKDYLNLRKKVGFITENGNFLKFVA